MKNNESKNKRKIKRLAVISILTVLAAAAVVICVVISGSSHSETYDFVYDAINKTESLDSFMIELSSDTNITKDGALLSTSTAGYIISDKDSDLMSVYVNTVSSTPDDPESDYDVTVSMYADGENVYDNSTGTDQKIDMTREEFDEIVSEYGLYKYDESCVKNIAFNENELEEFENCGEMSIKLSNPGDKVLKSYAEKLSEITGEDVTADKLTTKSAVVVYSIYDGMVASQNCNFTVEYTLSDGEIIQYSTSNLISYIEDFQDEDASEYIEHETTKEE